MLSEQEKKELREMNSKMFVIQTSAYSNDCEECKRLKERIKELERENAELTCQMKRNFYCYSCKNATEKCYRKEMGCPCGKYESYKDENAELKEKLSQKYVKFVVENGNEHDHFAGAKELLKNILAISVHDKRQCTYDAYILTVKKAEQFLKDNKQG